MGNELEKFLKNVADGLAESPMYGDFAKIEKVIDDPLSVKIKEVMSELSGPIVTALADELEKRGQNLDGHKTDKGFADYDHSKGGI